MAEPPKLKPILLNALNATAREDGWTTLSALGSQINRSHPSLDPRNYGVAKLGEQVRQQEAYLEVKEVKTGEGDSVQTRLLVGTEEVWQSAKGLTTETGALELRIATIPTKLGGQGMD